MIEDRAPFECRDSPFHHGRDCPYGCWNIQLADVLYETTSPVRAEANNEIGFAEDWNICIVRCEYELIARLSFA